MNYSLEAEQLLLKYGIHKPTDIELHSLAEAQGLVIRFQKLDTSEALVMGLDDDGIVYIDESNGAQRNNFSIAHELGHWELHHGENLLIPAKNVVEENRLKSKEQQADQFAFGLLMPSYMFSSYINITHKPKFDLIDEIVTNFNVSRYHASKRFVELVKKSVCFICADSTGIRQCQHSQYWPKFLKSREIAESFSNATIYLLESQTENNVKLEKSGKEFLDSPLACEYKVFIHSVIDNTSFDGIPTVLTLVSLISRNKRNIP